MHKWIVKYLVYSLMLAIPYSWLIWTASHKVQNALGILIIQFGGMYLGVPVIAMIVISFLGWCDRKACVEKNSLSDLK